MAHPPPNYDDALLPPTPGSRCDRDHKNAECRRESAPRRLDSARDAAVSPGSRHDAALRARPGRRRARRAAMLVVADGFDIHGGSHRNRDTHMVQPSINQRCGSEGPLERVETALTPPSVSSIARS